MTILLGNLALAVALLAAATALLAGMISARFNSAIALRVSRISLGVIFAMFTLASIALLGALIDCDFRLKYVAKFTERALPFGYKLAAFWAGQEGSLLLWAWLVAGFGAVWMLLTLRKRDAEHAIATAVIAVVCGFFAATMLTSEGNPFETFARMSQVPEDGRGLNPMLQDPGMIAHPPLLFLGYAGFTIPFAMLVGALMVRRSDNQWLLATRRWLIVAWAFLTVGILLGAQWAYVELGWGGYWAWDPVENASLLPWLTGTALLHSIMVQQQRGMLKKWNASLIAITFLLCIFATWITRSGAISSVHSFGKSIVGTFCLTFLVLGMLFTASLFLSRLKQLRSEHPLETLWGREGMFLITNVVLMIMMLVTTIGTTMPLLSHAFTGKQVSVKEPFYNSVVVPMGMLLMAMMAIGPLLGYGKDAADQLRRRIGLPLLGGALAVGVTAALRYFAPWALVSAFIIGVAAVSVVADLLQTTLQRARNLSENPVLALVRTIDGNHRRYGGQLVHVGMLMLMVGIAGSSLYKVTHDVQLSPGQSVPVPGGWHVRLDKLADARGVNYDAVEATVLLTDEKGRSQTLSPQRRMYDKWQEQTNTEVAIWSNLSRDAYVTLAGWEDGGRIVALQVKVNPLVAWLWIGGIVMTLGAVVCLLPRLLPVTETVAQDAVTETKSSLEPANGNGRAQGRKSVGPAVAAR